MCFLVQNNNTLQYMQMDERLFSIKRSTAKARIRVLQSLLKRILPSIISYQSFFWYTRFYLIFDSTITLFTVCSFTSFHFTECSYCAFLPLEALKCFLNEWLMVFYVYRSPHVGDLLYFCLYDCFIFGAVQLVETKLL